MLMFPQIESLLTSQDGSSQRLIWTYISDGLDNSLFSHTSDKTQARSLEAFVCAVHRGKSQRSSGTLCCDSRAWDVDVSHFSSFLYLFSPLLWLLRIGWVFPISSFLKRCCDSQGIQFTVVKAHLKSLSVSNTDNIKLYNHPENYMK